tara:strand:- start:44790 stop:46184 length:1395 start_codon:yes stop_codon:yes gene_type:complete
LHKPISKNTNWCFCPDCLGRGKKNSKRHKKSNSKDEIAIKKPKQLQQKICKTCLGSGLIASENPPHPNCKTFPKVAIIGGGIGGMALAVACLHRGIPFTVYERDTSFNARSQGYGLTLQQASKAIKGLGISSLEEGVISTKHVVHKTNGEVIGEWGMRKWVGAEETKKPKRTNIHIARQTLRLKLWEQLKNCDSIKWGHDLINLQTNAEGVALKFRVNNEIKTTQAHLVVGADGIRSCVRKLLFGNQISPLRYLNCMVILGICELNKLEDVESDLLDGATVFQTANGTDRIYIMPFTKDTIMWQFSFPVTETTAKALSKKGAQVLKEETVKRANWHSPIPQVLKNTELSRISGYPVYDRKLLTPEVFENNCNITLLGDAAHPMSPFKGQGANQALLDALSLARSIFINCRRSDQWRINGLRQSILSNFETEMIDRCAAKVKGSAEAAKLLHSAAILKPADKPRR